MSTGVSGKRSGAHCKAWSEELSDFLVSDTRWKEVRFGKLDLDADNVEEFKESNDWLELVEGVPFNIIYVEGEPRNSFPGAGIQRLLKRLERLGAEPV